MIYAQLGRYSRRHLTGSPGGRQGASVANTELLRAVIKHAAVDQVYMCADGVAAHQGNGSDGAYEELCEEWPTRSIGVKSMLDLPALVSGQQDLVFYTPGIFISALGQLRRAVGGTPFPVCAVTHSLDISVPYLFFPGAALFGESYDALIASSAAGQVAIEGMWDEVGELIAHAGGSAASRRRPRVVRIPLGIEPEPYSPADRMSYRQVLGIAPEEKVLLYVGRLCERSKADLEPLLVAFRSVLQDYPESLLLIAGWEQDGAYAKKLETIARELGIRARLKLLTDFPLFAKRMLYAASDVFVSPVDNTQETFGLAILEAMAAGLPVVASDWSGYRDLVVHGTTGFLVPTLWNSVGAERISTVASVCSEAFRRAYLAERTVVDVRALADYLGMVLRDEALRARLGAAGRRRVAEEYSWERIIPQHEELWGELLAESRACRDGNRRWSCEDYDSVYRHFASRPIDPEMRVRPSSLRRADSATRMSRGSIDPRELQRVLNECPAEGISIEDLSQEDGRSRIDAVAWLLKKGYLEFVPGSQG